MKPHTKIYMSAFGYGLGDFIPCEISWYLGNQDIENCALAVDTDHINNRGAGGDPTKSKDRIENLMACTRSYHDEWGDKPDKMALKYTIHKAFMIHMGVDFDTEWIDSQIARYEAINTPNYQN